MIKYLYFDDEPPESVSAYTDAITSIASDIELNIEHRSPKPWDEQVKFIREQEYSGLILDLRLDNNVIWENNDMGIKAQYRAEELAQKIRVEASEGILKDVPVVLWSTNQNLNNSGFNRDSTPKDLFDLKIIKTEIVANSLSIRKKLEALAKGYEFIEACYYENEVLIAKCLGLNGEHEIESIDPRVFSYFDTDFKPPIHDVARYILNELIRKPGPFIDEKLLATRFGINIEDSAGWEEFLSDAFSCFKYSGVFSGGWNIYNFARILVWWQDMFPQDKNLRSISSTRRIDLIREELGNYDLQPILPNDDADKGLFWYNCIATGQPVSQKNSFIVNTPHKLPWQENTYISFEAVRQRIDRTQGISIDELDKSRLEAFKERES